MIKLKPPTPSASDGPAERTQYKTLSALRDERLLHAVLSHGAFFIESRLFLSPLAHCKVKAVSKTQGHTTLSLRSQFGVLIAGSN